MSKVLKKVGRAVGKVVKVAARVAAAYYTGGTSELMFAQQKASDANVKAMEQMSTNQMKGNSQLAAAMLKPQEVDSVQAPDYAGAEAASAAAEEERRRKARSSGRASTLLTGGPLGQIAPGATQQKQLLGA